MIARGAARWLAAGVLSRLGFPARHAARRRRDRRFGVLLRYHRVIPPEESPSYYRMGIDARLFETQMEWLARACRVVSLDEYLDRAQDGRRTPPAEDLVVLTFDDGYRDNRTHAAPILARLGLPATFYVSSACFTKRMPFWPETVAAMLRRTRARAVGDPIDATVRFPLDGEAARAAATAKLIGRLRKLPAEAIESALARLGADLEVAREEAEEETPPVLSAADARELHAMGFTIGSHTVSHPYLPSESPETQRGEIEQSRADLEAAIGAPVVHFCYPGGGYDETTVALVDRAGYRSATTTDLGIAGPGDDRFRIPRLGVGEGLAIRPDGRFSRSLMEAEITGYFADLYRGRLRARRNRRPAAEPMPG
ncbi:MAG: polysaccharide deacetylase family protein [Candidatus Eisenbacteria bacterium]